MPNIRNMTVILSTAVATVGQDPNNSKVIAIAKDAVSFAPIAVTVDVLTPLEMVNSYDDHRVFQGQVDGALYQVETVGVGVQVTATIVT